MTLMIRQNGVLLDPQKALEMAPEMSAAAKVMHLSLLDYYGDEGMKTSFIAGYRIFLRFHRKNGIAKMTWVPEVCHEPIGNEIWMSWPSMCDRLADQIDAILSDTPRLMRSASRYCYWEIIGEPHDLSFHQRLALEALRKNS